MKMKFVCLPFIILFVSQQSTSAQDTSFYGMTSLGGNSYKGTIFKTDAHGANHSIPIQPFNPNNGEYPNGSLMLANNGKMYGVTTDGGQYGRGVLFEFNFVLNTYNVEFEFDNGSNGGRPYGALIQTGNGKLYGMTTIGGTSNMGVLFEYDYLTKIFTKKIDFDDVAKGNEAYGSLMKASNGKLYGMTHSGGTYNKGILFEYDPATEIFTKKIDFDGTLKGSFPYGSVMQANNGKLYGMTKYGGSFNKGVLFEYDILTDSLIAKINFDGINKGENPFGSLIQANNGLLYGMTRIGGTLDLGTIFEYNTTNDNLTRKISFNGTKGSYPMSSLMQAGNGKLYGMADRGGLQDKGALFEYDIQSNGYTKKLDFGGTIGEAPGYGNLIEVIVPLTEITDYSLLKMVSIFPNPSTGLVNIDLGNLSQAIVNVFNSEAGKLICQKEIISTAECQVLLTDLPSGIYIVEVIARGETRSFKLVKK